MAKRRKVLAKELAVELQGMPRMSDTGIHTVVSKTLKAAGLENESVSLSQWKRNVLEELPMQCLQPISLLSRRGDEMVIFHCCKIKAVLQHVVRNCQNYGRILLKEIDKEPQHVFQLILYHDECTAGNVLQHGSSKKCSLFYWAIREVGFLHHEEIWHPLALLQHHVANEIQGGFSAAWKKVIHSILDERLENGLDLQFDIDGHKHHRLFFCETKYWMGDLDAIRSSLDCKGSSGLRCCVRCKNVLKKGSDVSSADDFFQEITCCDTNKFDLTTNEEIFSVLDELLVESTRQSKTEMKRLEKIAGFSANPHGAMADERCRRHCPPDTFLFDPFHLYFGNGCCSWELLLFVDVISDAGLTRELLQQTIADTDWKTPCSAPSLKSRSARKQLMDEYYFTGDVYKGSGMGLQVLMPLIGYYVVELGVCTDPAVAPAWKSFSLLLRIRSLLNDFRHGVSWDGDSLSRLQCQHQTAFIACYGEDPVRPKHHVRFHLQEQYNETKLFIDTMPMEKRHRVT